ncbi:MAG: hypothetical protein J2P54_04050 [Bradyrhizobiaceae bacterium]|nr:hypothetical protein [Bradyrhizobiaceae bacterium]
MKTRGRDRIDTRSPEGLTALSIPDQRPDSRTRDVDESRNGLGAQMGPDEIRIAAAGGLIVDPGSCTFPFRSDFKGVGPNAWEP